MVAELKLSTDYKLEDWMFGKWKTVDNGSQKGNYWYRVMKCMLLESEVCILIEEN